MAAVFLAAVNAKYIHSNLAVYSMKSYCREYEKYVEIGEYTINQQKDEILKSIYKKQPKVLFLLYMEHFFCEGADMRLKENFAANRYLGRRT